MNLGIKRGFIIKIVPMVKSIVQTAITPKSLFVMRAFPNQKADPFYASAKPTDIYGRVADNPEVTFSSTFVRLMVRNASKCGVRF